MQQYEPDKTFSLYQGNGGEMTVCKGLYAIVDNGYKHWPCLIPPFKLPLNDEVAQWSKRLESVRKDAECTFGVLKQRFRILKTPFVCLSAALVDATFRACCATTQHAPQARWLRNAGQHQE